MSKPPTLATVLRRVAAREWPEVQSTISHAATVKFFHSAGHGGLVAQLPDEMPEAMRDALNGLRCEVLVVARDVVEMRGAPTAKGWRYYISSDYTDDSWADFKHRVAQHPLLSESGLSHHHEVLVGEEDCDWAPVLLALDACGVTADWDKGYSQRLGRMGRVAQAVECAQRWGPERLAAIIAAAPDAEWRLLITALRRDLSTKVAAPQLSDISNLDAATPAPPSPSPDSPER